MASLSWRVAVTRDEDDQGPLSSALRDEGFYPLRCVVMEEAPSSEPAALEAAAANLDTFDWLICSSARTVSALTGARTTAWPRAVRTAAVGARTAEALVSAGADPAPLVGASEGAEALWTALSTIEWTHRRVLVPTVPGGRRMLIDGLRQAGAVVTEVEAYRMIPRPAAQIRLDWVAAAPDAAVISSPSTASALIAGVGIDALATLSAIVAIGPTTAAALAAAGVPCQQAARADFREAARTLARLRDTAPPRAW
ncbi:MAG: uroporphyrinogen-III synthase [Acidobacteriota bacterium]|nr:uroporphyrinogen-III synthase [Acidobacteriota bacterium]